MAEETICAIMVALWASRAGAAVPAPVPPPPPQPLHWLQSQEPGSTDYMRRCAALCVAMAVGCEQRLLGYTTTIRDLYYRHPRAFGSQAGAAQAVALLGRAVSSLNSPHGHSVQREDLGFGATGKSVVAGNLSFVCGEGSVVDVQACGASGCIVSTDIALSARDFVCGPSPSLLVVEKECTFHALFRNEHLGATAPSCVAVCGRGYPCVAVRRFMRRFLLEAVQRPLCVVPVEFLVDGDADGILIMLSYLAALLEEPASQAPPKAKRTRPAAATAPAGSTEVALTHPPRQCDGPSLVCFRWLGVRPSNVRALLAACPARAPTATSFLSPRCRRTLDTARRRCRELVAACERPEGDANGGLLVGDMRRFILGVVVPEIDVLCGTGLKAELQVAESAARASDQPMMALLRNCPHLST